MVEVERLKEIVNKPANDITADDKAIIRSVAKLAGVKLPRARSCASCWVDCAVLAYVALKSQKSASYRLRDGVDIYFNGERVNAATITNARAERWLAAGLPRTYFVWS